MSFRVRQEEEFRQLLKIAFTTWNTTIQVANTIEHALHTHPEWTRNLAYPPLHAWLRRATK